MTTNSLIKLLQSLPGEAPIAISYYDANEQTEVELPIGGITVRVDSETGEVEIIRLTF